MLLTVEILRPVDLQSQKIIYIEYNTTLYDCAQLNQFLDPISMEI